MITFTLQIGVMMKILDPIFLSLSKNNRLGSEKVFFIITLLKNLIFTCLICYLLGILFLLIICVMMMKYLFASFFRGILLFVSQISIFTHFFIIIMKFFYGDLSSHVCDFFFRSTFLFTFFILWFSLS